MVLESLQTKFANIYGEQATGYASAPGRVNVIGEFTDYNLGFVLPAALEFRTYVLFRPRTDNKVVMHSANYEGESDSFELIGEIKEGTSHWGNYVRGVLWELQRRKHTLGGVEILISSNVPQGSGLSSSAALEVAVAGAMNTLFNLNIETKTLAVIGQEAENNFIGCACGIMDQLISAKGLPSHALMIDCRSLDTESVSIPDALSLVIVNSNYPRKLVDSEYNQRRSDCENAAKAMNVDSLRDADLSLLTSVASDISSNEYKRAHHVITENQRVKDMVAALTGNDMPKMIELMSASHHSLKHDFEVTVPATDGLVQICSAALGSSGAVRMTGGGFGGAIVCLCPHDKVDLVRHAVNEQYESTFGLVADIYVCKAGEGLVSKMLS